MANMTGWTWDVCRDQLDLPRVGAMRAAWKDNPPLVITMRMAAEALGAEFGGARANAQAPASQIREADPHALMAEIGQGELVPYVRPAAGLRLISSESDRD